MLFWRLTVTTFFFIGKKCHIPVFILFIAVHVGSYGWFHSERFAWFHSERFALLQLSDKLLLFIFSNSIYYAPVFAAGLVFSPQCWSQLLCNGWVVSISVIFVSLWGGLVVVPDFVEWNTAYIIQGTTFTHYPCQVLEGPISWNTFLNDTQLLLMRVSMAVASTVVHSAYASILAKFAPPVHRLMAGCGKRTLYGYYLQSLRPSLLLPFDGPWTNLLLVNIFVLVMLVTFCSSGTERLLRWAIIPTWMTKCAEVLWHFCSTSTEYLLRKQS
jgi:hypothetical protein